MSAWDGGFRDRWAASCPYPPHVTPILEHRPGLEPGKSGVAVRRLVHFGIRCVAPRHGFEPRVTALETVSLTIGNRGKPGRPGGSRTHMSVRRHVLSVLRK